MAKPSCKCKKSECEECPEWIFTFADLVMLMMGFFVILWVTKPGGGKQSAEVDERWLEVVAKIREAFDYLPDPTSKDPVDIYMLMKKLEEMDPLKGHGEGGETKRKPRGATGTDPEVITIRPGKHSIVGTRVGFDANSADLNVEARRALDQIGKTIQGHRQIFLVKGHASQDDFATAPQDAKVSALRMDLSVRRAQAAADYLMTHGVEPEILRVQGCSTFEPVAQRAYTDDLRVLNRRVEVEGTDSPVTSRQDKAQMTHVLPPGLGAETSIAPVETIEQ